VVCLVVIKVALLSLSIVIHLPLLRISAHQTIEEGFLGFRGRGRYGLFLLRNGVIGRRIVIGYVLSLIESGVLKLAVVREGVVLCLRGIWDAIGRIVRILRGKTIRVVDDILIAVWLLGRELAVIGAVVGQV
jgi:hypothetical protein